MGVEGNEKANGAVKEAAERTARGSCPGRFTSLAHIGRTISERNWNEAKYLFRTENDRRLPPQKARYDPMLKSKGPDEVAMKEAVYVSKPFFQLKSGYAVMGTYLHCIGMTGTDRCWECSTQARIDPRQVLLDYST